MRLTPHPHPWSEYSKKLIYKIENPRSFGFFTENQAKNRNMRLVIGSDGDENEGNIIKLFLLVDEEDGIIADVKYQLFGDSALIGAAEAASDLLIHKNYLQATRLTGELIDKQLRDHPNKEAFPFETSGHINLVLSAIEEAAEQCMDIPITDAYISSPIEGMPTEVKEYPGWLELPDEKKLLVLEEVIASEVRPYIELDAGGIDLVKIEKNKLTIAYSGSCTSCYSAIGSTLNSIQEILRMRVHPELVVEPDMSKLNLEV